MRIVPFWFAAVNHSLENVIQIDFALKSSCEVTTNEVEMVIGINLILINLTGDVEPCAFVNLGNFGCLNTRQNATLSLKLVHWKLEKFGNELCGEGLHVAIVHLSSEVFQQFFRKYTHSFLKRESGYRTLYSNGIV